MGLRNYGLVGSLDELAGLCDRLLQGDGPIAGDIETGYLGPDREKGSLHPETSIIAGISFTNSTDWARYVALAHDDTSANLDNEQSARLLWPVAASGRLVAHNSSFESRNLSRWFLRHLADDPTYGAAVRASNGYFPVHSDTLVESYLAAEYPSFGLKFLVKAMFGHEMVELHELFPDLPKNRRKMLRFNILDPHDPKIISYACEDSVWALAIHEHYYERVRRDYSLLYQAEMGVLEAVCEMEDFGVRYDWGFMRRGLDELRAFRDSFNAEIMHELTEMTGTPTAVNLGSPKQISDLLFGQLGLRTSRYTASTRNLPPAQRKMSTDKIALERLAKQYPVVRKITEWKEMRRLDGTYLDKYQSLYDYAPDGRTHPNHLTCFVVTGRFAVSDPPYQQSPKVYHFDLEPARQAHAAHADAHGPKCTCTDSAYQPPAGSCFRFNFRDAICAPDDHYILGFDLSQAELRAIAGEANETALLEAFATGQDVHTLTAALMLKIPIEAVDKDQRAIGKTMNFALLYGMGVKSLADRLAIPIEEAQALYDTYFAVYANIAAWAEKQREHGKTHGYVTSRFGRRLPIWEYASEKHYIRQTGDRACVNYPIQGAATGDYVKIAMVRARKALRAAGLADRVHLVMNVHDALEFYVHRSLSDPAALIRLLTDAVIFAVPGWPAMQADWHIGKRWGSLMDVTLTGDGRLLVKGEKVTEIRPSVEVDEDTGEEVEALPEVDPDALRAAVEIVRPRQPMGESMAGSAEAKRVIVALAEMPDEGGYRRFIDLLHARPGPHTVLLRTPEGELDVTPPGGSDLHPGDLGQVCLLLGTARILHDAADVEPGALVADLAL